MYNFEKKLGTDLTAHVNLRATMWNQTCKGPFEFPS